MLNNVIFFDGGGSGIRAKSQAGDGKSITKNFTGFSPGELPLVDYLANLIIDFAFTAFLTTFSTVMRYL